MLINILTGLKYAFLYNDFGVISKSIHHSDFIIYMGPNGAVYKVNRYLFKAFNIWTRRNHIDIKLGDILNDLEINDMKRFDKYPLVRDGSEGCGYSALFTMEANWFSFHNETIKL